MIMGGPFPKMGNSRTEQSKMGKNETYEQSLEEELVEAGGNCTARVNN